MNVVGGCFVFAERRAASRSVDLYIMSQDRRFQLRNLSGGEGDGEWVEVVHGARMEPSIVLSDYLAEGIAKALADTIPPSSSMQRHLDDAIKVRDQLLTLVDRKFK